MKIYKVSTYFSHREIQARNKKEAIQIFKNLLGTLISKHDKITVE